VFVVVAWRDEHEEAIPAATVAASTAANRAAREAALPTLEAGLVSAGVEAYPGGVAGGGLALSAAARPGAHRGAAHGPSKRIVVAYGFWIFLISDIILFSALFASYAVLTDATAGGPTGRDLFELPTVAVETACLLLSTVFCGLRRHRRAGTAQRHVLRAMAATFVLGATFVAIELHEFATMIHAGAGPEPQRLPVGVLRADRLPRPARQRRPAVAADDDGAGVRQGLPRRHPRRLLCFALFWHTLDIIWVALFSLVYLVGVAPAMSTSITKPTATSPPATSSAPPTFPTRSAAISSAWRWRRC
jgi:cytochrome o ubiquinol oxidase subunit 3